MNPFRFSNRLADVVPQIQPVMLLMVLQMVVLFFGLTHWDFEITVLDIASVLVAAIGTEFVASRKIYFPRGVIVSALGIAIFLRAAHPWYFAAAGVIAVLSRYVIKDKKGHFFNPSNLAILVIVVLFPSLATIEFTQWGASVYAYVGISMAALYTAYRAGVIVTTLSFIAGYATLLLALVPFYTDLVSVHHYGLLGPSFILFASFMVTDPRTSPSKRPERFLHGISVALLLFALELFGVRYGMFVAAFCVTLLNVLFRKLTQGKAFRPSLLDKISNIPSFFIVLAAFASAVAIVPVGISGVQARSLSVDFLVRGVESAGIMRCSNEAVMRASEVASFGSGTYTTGAAWGDYDSDGYDDLFLSRLGSQQSALYRNNGDGTFTDTTLAAGLPRGLSSSAVFADYDNDGRLDLFIPYINTVGISVSTPFDFARSSSTPAFRVYHNEGKGVFADVTNRLGLGRFSATTFVGGAFSFGDYNNDGFLDVVFVTGGSIFPAAKTNTALLKSLFDPRFDDVTDVVCDAKEATALYESLGNRAYGMASDARTFIAEGGCLVVNYSLELSSTKHLGNVGPREVIDALWFMPGGLYLFENVRGRSFVEHTEFEAQALGVDRSYTYTAEHLTHPSDVISRHFFQPITFDYDNDGRQDIFITSGWGNNILLRNSGDFTFADVTAEAGLDYAGSGMGVSIGDVTGDGIQDIMTTNVLRDYLFEGGHSNRYALSDQQLGGIGLGWGASFLDYDLDGKEDLYITNGDVPRTARATNGSLNRSLYRTDRLYHNLGSSVLGDATWKDFCPDSQSGRALAVSDFDNNGTPDIFVGNIAVAGQSNSADVLYVNGARGHAYLKIRLKGISSNSFGVGARITVTTETTSQTKLVFAGSNYYSENSLRTLFGLGTMMTGDTVQVSVLWPSGRRTVKSAVPVNSEVTIVEGI